MNKQNLTRPNVYRAKQFAPFAALRGFYGLIKECQHVIEPRRTPTDDYAAELDVKMHQVKPGQIVTVTYYNHDGYDKMTGIVSRFDANSRILTIIKTPISFDDIWEIEGDEIAEQLFE